jgi:aarF domain-containing kinase
VDNYSRAYLPVWLISHDLSHGVPPHAWLFQDEEIQSEVSRYLPQIADILNRVPRQLLLILKTNDLLRGIECVLRTRASSSSFINMAKCCTRAVANYDQTLCNTWMAHFRISLHLQWNLFKIQIYGLYLYARTLVSGKKTLLWWMWY